MFTKLAVGRVVSIIRVDEINVVLHPSCLPSLCYVRKSFVDTIMIE